MTTTDTKPNPLANLLGAVLSPKTEVSVKPAAKDLLINIEGVPAPLVCKLLKELFTALDAGVTK